MLQKHQKWERAKVQRLERVLDWQVLKAGLWNMRARPWLSYLTIFCLADLPAQTGCEVERSALQSCRVSGSLHSSRWLYGGEYNSRNT